MTQTGNSGFLLFSGANDRAVIALCRGMTRYGVPFGLIGRNGTDLLKRSSYADHYLLDRASERLEFDEILEATSRARQRYGVQDWVICPTSEYLNIVLFAMRDRLEKEGIKLATCDEALYTRVSDKLQFRKYCAELGVPAPELLTDGVEGLPVHPFVAKPRQNLSRTGRILYPYLVRTAEQRMDFRRGSEIEEFYFERFVEGESWYLLYHVDARGQVAHGAQRNFLQQGKGKSIVVARAMPYPEPEVCERFASRLVADGYRGFIMVEIRRTSEGEPVAIEANPRCWGPFQLTIDARMGLFEAFLRDHGHDVPDTGSARRSFYCWTGGIVQAIRSGKGLDRHGSALVLPGILLKALVSDVYVRRDAWSCFSTDLWAN